MAHDSGSLRYHDATKHSVVSVRQSRHVLDWDTMPRPFKVYPELDAIVLPRELATSTRPALAALAGGRATSGQAAPLDRAAVARLLYFTAGVLRRRTYPGGETFFRAAACTGALHHIDCYLVSGPLTDLEAGVYHFGPHDFALRQLRAGDHRAALVEASGGDPAVAAAPVTVVCTTTFWRNAWKYQARAYRHAFWDAGTLVANLLAVAGAVDLSARVVVGFADTTVNGLLDLDPTREVAVCLVPLGRGASPPPAPPAPPLHLATLPPSSAEVDYPAIRAAHTDSSLGTGSEAASWRRPVPSRPAAPAAIPLAPLDVSTVPEPIEAVIRRRGSTREFARTPIDVAQLATILWAANRPIDADWLTPGAALSDPYVIVNDVTGLTPGSYAADHTETVLTLLRSGNLRNESGFLALGQALAADAAVCIYWLADPHGARSARRSRLPGRAARGGDPRRPDIPGGLRARSRRDRPHLLRRRRHHVLLAPRRRQERDVPDGGRASGAPPPALSGPIRLTHPRPSALGETPMSAVSRHRPGRSLRVLLRPAWMVAVSLAMFAGARVALFVAWRSDFEGLSRADLLHSMIAGLRFDLAVLAVVLAPAVVGLVLPFRWCGSRAWRAALGWYGFAVLAMLIVVLGGDVCYFGLVHRHVGMELVSLQDDSGLVLAAAFDDYRLALLAGLVLVVATATLWRRLMRWDERLTGRSAAPVWLWIAVAPLLAVAMRGTVDVKPIGPVNAFEAGSVPFGQLTLNAPFTVLHAITRTHDVDVNFLGWREAVESTQAQVVATGERLVSAALPVQRVRPAGTSERPHVVVILLESWDALAVDAIRTEVGEEPLGLTPNFDALAHQGLLLTRCYAAGQRSMDGMSAVLAGVPTLPGLPYVGQGLEQSRLSYLGSLARADGYSTYFVQGSKRTSFRGNAIAAMAGFDHYEGMEDIVARRGVRPMGEWGAWDEDALLEAHRLFSEATSPFLGFAFTTSTHPPFQIPDARFRRYPRDTPQHRFWNSIHYADWALGRFVEAARTSGWFDRTIFVLIGDHTSGIAPSVQDLPGQHHIACLLLAPGLSPRIERRVTSQLDIVPTLVELAGWRGSFSAYGRSLLDPEGWATRGALAIHGDLVLRIEEGGWVVHDLVRRLEAYAQRPDVDVAAIEGRMLSLLQVATISLRRNLVYSDAGRLAVANGP